MEKTKNIGILIFDDVEVLDFCGPFEVFSVTGYQRKERPFKIFTVAENSPVTARNGLSVNPTYFLSDDVMIDILLVPGGMGTRREISNTRLIEWIKKQAAQAELVLSVCTGSLLLAKCGLLKGLDVTTHHGAIDLLTKLASDSRVLTDRRFIDNETIILSSGISAGIDMSLYTVAKLLGKEIALETAEHMEYDWKPELI
jgi:transcriptional regulator GlxA family with amidase domain